MLPLYEYQKLSRFISENEKLEIYIYINGSIA